MGKNQEWDGETSTTTSSMSYATQSTSDYDNGNVGRQLECERRIGRLEKSTKAIKRGIQDILNILSDRRQRRRSEGRQTPQQQQQKSQQLKSLQVPRRRRLGTKRKAALRSNPAKRRKTFATETSSGAVMFAPKGGQAPNEIVLRKTLPCSRLCESYDKYMSGETSSSSDKCLRYEGGGVLTWDQGRHLATHKKQSLPQPKQKVLKKIRKKKKKKKKRKKKKKKRKKGKRNRRYGPDRDGGGGGGVIGGGGGKHIRTARPGGGQTVNQYTLTA